MQYDTGLPKWLAMLAWRVYELVRRPEHMRRFQEMVREWARWHYDQVLKERDCEDRWREHFEVTIPSDPRLQDAEAGRPEPDWQWRTYGFSRKKKAKTGTKWEVVHVEGWCPPDLVFSDARILGDGPDALPLPLSNERALSLREQYAVLAAIHDSGTKGVPKIQPWTEAEVEFENGGFTRATFERNNWRELVKQVPALTQRDEPAIEVFLQSVERDLETRAEKPKPRSKVGGAKPARRRKKTARDRPTRRQAEAHASQSAPLSTSLTQHPEGLEIDEASRIARWNGCRLSINSHADFEVLCALYTRKGALVPYTDLLRGIDTERVLESIRISEVPPEVKNAVSHIRSAFRTVNCGLKVRNLRNKGYQLLSPDE